MSLTTSSGSLTDHIPLSAMAGRRQYQHQHWYQPPKYDLAAGSGRLALITVPACADLPCSCRWHDSKGHRGLTVAAAATTRPHWRGAPSSRASTVSASTALHGRSVSGVPAGLRRASSCSAVKANFEVDKYADELLSDVSGTDASTWALPYPGFSYLAVFSTWVPVDPVAGDGAFLEYSFSAGKEHCGTSRFVRLEEPNIAF